LLIFFLWLIFVEPKAQSVIHADMPVSNCPRSQKQANIWYFGDKAGIDFRSAEALPLTDGNVMTSIKTGAVISDSLGNLLFYTDGKKVWNRNFELMSETNSLDGDQGATQPAIIVPFPADPDRYYIFTIDIMAFNPDNTYTTKGLTYTVIDMKMRNGLGNITEIMNIPLLNPVCQKLTAVKHNNGHDYWIIVHEWNSSRFFSFLISSDGISDPVISSAGSFIGGGYADQNNAFGYMKAAPDGSKIALAITGLNKIELYDFNNTSGIVSNPLSFTSTDPGISPYGIEFSSDARKLYSTHLQVTGDGPPAFASKIYQFDLRNGLNNPVLIDSVPGVRIGGLQLAVDGRIYVSRTINLTSRLDSLDVIYNPNRPGKECNYNLLNNLPGARFSLAGRQSIYGLPNFIQSYFDIPAFTFDSICFRDLIFFNITNKANIDSVLWDFGDGTTSADQDPDHIYPSPGTYLVRLTESFNGASYTDSGYVKILQLPYLHLGDTILLYSGSSINLHAGGGFTDYLWSTGSGDSIINVESGGNYIVRVKDEHCCYNSDTVYIKPFHYYAPSAFTPNGDGKNEVFRLIGLYSNVQMNLSVYNRWGELIFNSDDLYTGWDGTSGGQISPEGTYIWVAKIRFLDKDVVTNNNVVLKGSITLLR
jgi:gliding motility-associated-like protein